MGGDGRDVGKVRLIAKLAQGGMGDVHLAVNVGPGGFNKIVVLKQLRAALAEDPQFLTMFLDEARIAARLSHRNIVQTYEVTIDAGPAGPRYFITMEYLDGQPYHKVRRRIADRSKLSLAHEVRILSECLAGLHDAHELADFDGTPLEIVHRDVSPHNVFVTYDGQVKIVDFGIAKALDSGSETQIGVFKGKVTYVSPEQAKGAPCDRRADVFSVGVMLWEAIAGERLWANMPEVAILNNLLAGATPSVRTANPAAPEELVRICEKAMSTNRDDRYASAAEMQAELDAYLATHAAPAPSAKDLAKVVSEAFTEERRAMKTLIDGQLRAIRSTAHEASSPSSPVAPEPISSPSSTPSNHGPTSHGASGPLGNASSSSISAILSALAPRSASGDGWESSSHPAVPPAPPSAVTIAAPTGSVEDDESDVSPLPQLFPTSPPTASFTAAPTARNLAVIAAQPARSRAQSYLLGGLALATVAVLSILGANGMLLPKPPERTISAVPLSPEPESDPTVRAPETPKPPTDVDLSLLVTPLAAELTLDGRDLSGNPFHGRVPSDGAPHALRVRAPGYVERTVEVHLDRDQNLEIVLEHEPMPVVETKPALREPARHDTQRPQPTAAREPKPTPSPAVSLAQPAASAEPAPAATAAKPSKVKRRIDSEDPYSQ